VYRLFKIVDRSIIESFNISKTATTFVVYIAVAIEERQL
jgi:hypothetical protein